jgi:hypothetical protein
MLRRYLARRKMRWAVRRVAAMSPSLRRCVESSRQVRRVWRIAERALPELRLRAHTAFWALTDAMPPAEAEKADRLERFYYDTLDRLNPAK